MQVLLFPLENFFYLYGTERDQGALRLSLSQKRSSSPLRLHASNGQLAKAEKGFADGLHLCFFDKLTDASSV